MIDNELSKPISALFKSVKTKELGYGRRELTFVCVVDSEDVIDGEDVLDLKPADAIEIRKVEL